MTAVEINATLAPCGHCEEPLNIADGTNVNDVTIWGPPDHPYITAHATECPFRGQEAPAPDWGVDPFEEN